MHHFAWSRVACGVTLLLAASAISMPGLVGTSVTGGEVEEAWVNRYSAPFGGDDQAHAVAVDPGGNVVVAGTRRGWLWISERDDVDLGMVDKERGETEDRQPTPTSTAVSVSHSVTHSVIRQRSDTIHPAGSQAGMRLRRSPV